MTSPSPRRRFAERFPCVGNTASVDGLKDLGRVRPRGWAKLLVRHAPDANLDVWSTVSEVVGTRVDERALPRSDRDAGRLRQARWCAAVLAEHVPHLRVLDVDCQVAVQIEETLIQVHGLAPSSARKARGHLLALRDSVARRLGRAELGEVPATGPPEAWQPRLDLDGYYTARVRLPWALRVATDLLATCRLRPATVLALRVADVGPRGATIRLWGRGGPRELPTPAFLQADLAALARGGAGDAPLWPGRTREGTYGVAALRRRFRAAAEETLGEGRDLRDLSDLAASVLGPASANPAGRCAALERVAPRWVRLETPPLGNTPASGVPRSAGRAVEDPRVDVLEGELARIADRLDELTEMLETERGARRQATSKVGSATQRLRSDLSDVRSRLADLDRLTELVDRHGRAGRALSRQTKSGREDKAAFERRLLSNERALDDLGRSHRRLRGAVTGLSVPVGALLVDKVLEAPESERWQELVGALLEEAEVGTPGLEFPRG